MAIDYKRYEFRTYEYLVRLENELAYFNIADERLASVKELIASHRFQAAVMGEFKRGKSTLINALLGLEVLPADATPATATLNRVTYGSQPRAVLEYKDGRRQEVAVDTLADYVTKLTSHSADNARQIKQAVVEYPTVFCQNDVDIIDTPGLQDDAEMTAITIQNIRDVDLAIIAISARFAFSETECGFIVQLLEAGTITKLVVMVTYIDTVDKEDREDFLDYLSERIKSGVLKRLKSKYPPEHEIFTAYQRMIGELEIFPVSSKQALKAKASGDVMLLEESGIQKVQRELTRLFLANRRNNVVIKGVGTIQAVCEQAIKTTPKSISEMKEQLLKLEQGKESKMPSIREEKHEGWNTSKDQIISSAEHMEELLKNDLCSRFIRRLSSIRERNSIVVENGLRQEIRESFQHVSTQYNQPFLAEAENGIMRFLDECGIEDNIFQNILKPQFGWCISPLPQVKDLLQCEVIDFVRRAIEESTCNYINNCRNYVNLIEKRLDDFWNQQDEENERQRIGEIEDNLKKTGSTLEKEERKWEERKAALQQIQIEAKEMLDEFFYQIKQENT